MTNRVPPRPPVRIDCLEIGDVASYRDSDGVRFNYEVLGHDESRRLPYVAVTASDDELLREGDPGRAIAGRINDEGITGLLLGTYDTRRDRLSQGFIHIGQFGTYVVLELAYVDEDTATNSIFPVPDYRFGVKIIKAE